MGGASRGGSASIEQPNYWWYAVRTRLLHTALSGYVGAAENVLDVGSADGPSVGWLQGTRLKVSLDLDPRGLPSGSGVCGSALALPLRSEAFDVVGAFDVIEHCEPEEQVVSELARVLRPGGRLLISVPAYQWAWSDFDDENGHVRRYTRPRAVRALEGEGLEILRASYAFTATFPLFVAERAARKIKQAARREGRAAAADVVSLPRVSPRVERLLHALGSLDERMLGRTDLAFGSSVVLAARKV